MWREIKALFDSKETKMQKALGLYWVDCKSCNGEGGTQDSDGLSGGSWFDCNTCKGYGNMPKTYYA